MRGFSFGLFLFVFQAVCHGAVVSAFPEPNLPDDSSFSEHRVRVKRAVCAPGQVDVSLAQCTVWQGMGFCTTSIPNIKQLAEQNCPVTCGVCQSPPTTTPPIPVCAPGQVDVNPARCSVWQGLGFCTSSTPSVKQLAEQSCPVTCGVCQLPPPTTAPPGPTTPGPTTSPPLPAAEAACLKAHNDKRALHGSPPLVWNATLAQHALTWADHLAGLGRLEHEQNIDEGENLFKSSGRNPTTCVDAVESWYAEVSEYDYGSPGFSLETAHFTQIVWRATTQVGAAAMVEVNDQGQLDTYIVARYSPPGNVQGQFSQNVVAPIAEVK